MNCDDARRLIPDAHRGLVSSSDRDALEGHLATCADCRHEDAAEGALTEALLRRLPQHAAPLALKRRIAKYLPEAPARRTSGRWRVWLASALAACLLVLGVYWQRGTVDALADARLVGEAVNDHLRVVDGDEPLAIVSSGIHEVKPWFQGKIDFAPLLAFAGDADYPLRGGAVSHFLDRKAATFVYGRRQHVISLYVFRADGLSWPSRGLTPLGHARAKLGVERGFSTIVWRDGELGYALVSDLNMAELVTLGAKVAGAS